MSSDSKLAKTAVFGTQDVHHKNTSWTLKTIFTNNPFINWQEKKTLRGL
jgi:hypothetical protein